jgi:hypothetical protein
MQPIVKDLGVSRHLFRCGTRHTARPKKSLVKTSVLRDNSLKHSMKNIKSPFISSFCILLLLGTVAGFAAAQAKRSRNMAPTIAPTGIFDAKTLKENLPSLELLPEGEVYVSKEGGFAISLPGQPLFIFAPHGTGSWKHKFIWWLKECDISVAYEDLRKVDEDAEFEEILSDFKKVGISASLVTKVTSLTPVTSGEYGGYEIAFDTKDNSRGISRIFRAGNRAYCVTGITDQSRPDVLPLIRRVIDSFKVGAETKLPSLTYE